MSTVESDPKYWGNDDWLRKEEAENRRESQRSRMACLGIGLTGAVLILLILAYYRGYFTLVTV